MRTLLCCLAVLTSASIDAAHAQTETPGTGSTETPPPIEPPAAESTDPNTPASPPPPPSRAPEDIPLIDLQRIETEDLRLLYFDPQETFLTPYVGRSFENALDYQQRMF